MNYKLLGALVIGATMTHQAVADWRPPAELREVPAVVSQAHPVRVVTTSRDSAGRPVVTTRTATDRPTARRLVAAGGEIDPRVTIADAGEHAATASRTGEHAAGGEVAASAVGTATDQYAGLQWDLTAMRVPGAWPRATGAGVTVAVIDSGVDASHPDLAGQVLPGADFVAGTEGVATDPHGHGTHVAGTIAALTGNGTGIAGVAPEARILPVRVLGADGSGYMSDVANGILFAADHGADVINMSISATDQLSAVTDAVTYARSRGIVVVAAAGNSRAEGSPTAYPAADPGVVAVAATDAADAVAAFSNRGGYVDVAAPGSGIVSTFPSGQYRRMSGTSMAAPHVAALAALLKSADPGLTPDRVERVIEESAADLGTPGRDDDFGHGRVDATAALARIEPAPAQPQPAPAPIEEQPAPGPDTTTPSPDTTTPSPDTTTPSPDTTTPNPEPTAPSPAVTPGPQPAPTTPSPEPTPAPTFEGQASVRLVRTGPEQLTVVLDGVDGQTVQVQRLAGDWATVSTYPAARVLRVGGLTSGYTYRIVVGDSARLAGTVSDLVQF